MKAIAEFLSSSIKKLKAPLKIFEVCMSLELLKHKSKKIILHQNIPMIFFSKNISNIPLYQHLPMFSISKNILKTFLRIFPRCQDSRDSNKSVLQTGRNEYNLLS